MKICFYSVSRGPSWHGDLVNQRVESVPVCCWRGKAGAGRRHDHHRNMDCQAFTDRPTAISRICCWTGGFSGFKIQSGSPAGGHWGATSLHVLQRNWRFSEYSSHWTPAVTILIPSLQVKDTLASHTTCLICWARKLGGFNISIDKVVTRFISPPRSAQNCESTFSWVAAAN